MLAVLLLVLVLAATSAGVAARAIAHSEAVRGRSGGDAARAGADATVAAIWANWDPVARAADSVGTSTRMLATGDSVVIEAHVSRTSPRLWWVTAQSWSLGASASRLVPRATGFALWLAAGAAIPSAAVSGDATVTVDSLATIRGGRTTPPGWSCVGDAPLDALALGPAAPPPIVLGALRGTISGPGGIGASTAADWEAEWNRMTAVASHRFPRDTVVTPMPDSSASGCSGWGEPDRSVRGAACIRRFAIVHASGALTLTGGRGQGVLLVEGPLTLDGTAFTGLILAHASVRLTGGARLLGGVVIAGPQRSPVTFGVADSSLIAASSCAMAASLVGGALFREVPSQAWYWLW